MGGDARRCHGDGDGDGQQQPPSLIPQDRQHHHHPQFNISSPDPLIPSQLQDNTTVKTAAASQAMDPPSSSSSSIRWPHLDRSRSFHLHSSWPTDPIKHHPPSDGQPPLRRSSTTTTHRRQPTKLPSPPGAKKVTLYLTSLQGVRRTFDDCRAVRSILRGFRVAVDERDLAMDSSYRRELQGFMGGRPMSLPQVFVGRRWLGGADQIRRLQEDGDLARVLQGVAVEDTAFVCHVCGGARFVPCLSCSGSRKVFVEEEAQLRRCSVCNENGLVRCVHC